MVHGMAPNNYDCGRGGRCHALIPLLDSLVWGLGVLLSSCWATRVVGLPFCSLSTLVSRIGELRDVLDFMHGEILQHLLVLHSLWECDVSPAHCCTTWRSTSTLGHKYELSKFATNW
jgi:hypothetical protein